MKSVWADTIKQSVTSQLQESKIFKTNEAIERVHEIGGGCISEAFACETSANRKIFVKLCVPNRQQTIQQCLAMFNAERIGLEAICKAGTIRVPTPYGCGILGNNQAAFLAMEYIEFSRNARNSDSVQQKLGTQLAKMHKTKGPDQFGFEVNNTIGSTPQDNTWTSDWVEFLRRRLSYQFSLASEYPELTKAGNRLLDTLHTYFEGIEIQPSLIHGDLWSGNYAVDENNNPVIMDPAAYYGHHEAELGIMKLFGGFSTTFYAAYHAVIPKAPGHEQRVDIYALYHAVNHLNMFGSSYLGLSMSLLNSVLRNTHV